MTAPASPAPAPLPGLSDFGGLFAAAAAPATDPWADRPRVCPLCSSSVSLLAVYGDAAPGVARRWWFCDRWGDDVACPLGDGMCLVPVRAAAGEGARL